MAGGAFFPRRIAGSRAPDPGELASHTRVDAMTT
jgi:hypothetical protein